MEQHFSNEWNTLSAEQQYGKIDLRTLVFEKRYEKKIKKIKKIFFHILGIERDTLDSIAFIGCATALGPHSTVFFFPVPPRTPSESQKQLRCFYKHLVFGFSPNSYVVLF